MHTATGNDVKLPSKVLMAKNRLAEDFDTLVSDAEALLKSTATYSGESLVAARGKFQDTLNQFRGRVSDARGAAVGKINHAATATHEYVHENPWKVVGAAVVAGVIFGILMQGGKSRDR